MNYFYRLLLTIFIIGLFSSIIAQICNFLDVPISLYGTYLLWFSALALLYTIIGGDRNKLLV